MDLKKNRYEFEYHIEKAQSYYDALEAAIEEKIKEFESLKDDVQYLEYEKETLDDDIYELKKQLAEAKKENSK